MNEKLVPVKSCVLQDGASTKRYYHLKLQTDRPGNMVIDSDIILAFYEDSGVAFDPNPEDTWKLVTAEWVPNIATDAVIVGVREKEQDKGRRATYLLMIDRGYCCHIIVDFLFDGAASLDPEEPRRGCIHYNVFGDTFETLREVLPDLVP